MGSLLPVCKITMAEKRNTRSAAQQLLEMLGKSSPGQDQVIGDGSVQHNLSEPQDSGFSTQMINASVPMVTNKEPDEKQHLFESVDVQLHETTTHEPAATINLADDAQGRGDSGAEKTGPGVKMHLCRVCGAVLDSSQDLLLHAQQHLTKDDDETHKCRVCSIVVHSASQLVQHLQAHSVLELVTCNSLDGQEEEGRELECTLCKDKFSSSHTLYQHILTAHNTSENLHCPLCSKTFRATCSKSFLSHLNGHVAEPEIPCDMFGKRFRTQTALSRHMESHEPRPIYLCPTCGKQYALKTYYERHVKSHKEHTGNVQNEDKRDNVTSEMKEGFRQRQRREQGEYTCKICGKVQRTKGHLSLHMKNHVKYGPVLKGLHCSICNLVFMNKSELKKHSTLHKQENSVARNSCPLCYESFQTNKEKMVHVRRAHPDYKPYKCSKCDKAYKSAFDRYRHELSHEGKRAYQCPHCPRQLHSVQNLKQHILIKHSGIERKKGETCEKCGRMFYTKHQLQDHVRYSHGNVRYKCSYCGQVMKTKQSLQFHESIHTGELPFECGKCGEKFRLRADVKRHHTKVHEKQEKTWKCRDCDSAFRNKALLASHVRRVHLQCFQCLECFPSRDVAKKHRCKLYRADMYLKQNGQADCKENVSDSTIVSETIEPSDSVLCHDAFLEMVMAAERLERGTDSEPVGTVQEGSADTSMTVIYTLTQKEDDPSSATIKFPRFRIQKSSAHKKSDCHESGTLSAAVRNRSSCQASSVITMPAKMPEHTLTLSSTSTVETTSHSGVDVPAMFEPLPRALEQGRMFFPSLSTILNTDGNASKIVAFSSPLKSAVHPDHPIPSDLVIMQDHDYHNMPVVFEAEEVSQPVLSSMGTAEPSSGTSEPTFAESAYPSECLLPGNEIVLDDFFASLNNHETLGTKTENDRARDDSQQSEKEPEHKSQRTELKPASANVGRAKRRVRSQAKRQHKEKAKTDFHSKQAKNTSNQDAVCGTERSGDFEVRVSDVAGRELIIKVEGQGGLLAENERVWHSAENEQGVYIVVGGSEDMQGVHGTQDVLVQDESKMCIDKDDPFVKEEEEGASVQVKCITDTTVSMKEETNGLTDADEMLEDDVSGDFEPDPNTQSKNVEIKCSQPVKQPLSLQLIKTGTHQNQVQHGVANTSQHAHPRVKPPHQNVFCDVCGRKFHTCQTLQRHLQVMHKCDEYYSCQHCLFVTPSFSRLTAHFEQHARLLKLSNGVSTTTCGDLLNTPQKVGPLWEAFYTSSERNCTVFVALSPENASNSN